MNMKRTFGLKVKVVRTKAELSSADFAKSIGASKSAFSAWESGKILMPLCFLIELVRQHNVEWDFFDPFRDIITGKRVEL